MTLLPVDGTHDFFYQYNQSVQDRIKSITARSCVTEVSKNVIDTKYFSAQSIGIKFLSNGILAISNYKSIDIWDISAITIIQTMENNPSHYLPERFQKPFE